MRKKFTILTAALALLAMLAVPTGGWGQTRESSSYTITFKTGSGDGTAINTSTSCSTIVSGGANYLSGNVATASSAYHSGASGLKLGASSSAGSLKMNLSSIGQVTPSTIVIRAKRYNSSKAATISVNGETAQDVGSEFNNYTFSFNTNTSITYLQLNSSKYLWVESVTVNYDIVDEHTLTITQSTGGTINVKYSNGDEVTTGASIAEGTVLNVEAASNVGYVFTNWTATSGTLGNTNANPTTFTMGTTDAEISALFTQNTTQYTVSIADGITNGTVSASPTSCVVGTQVTLTITPATSGGYYLETLTVTDEDDNEIEVDEDNRFIMPASNVTVNATFSNYPKDVLNRDFTGVANNASYTEWNNKNGSSSIAVYAGKTGGANNSIQLNATSGNGIISTTSGGYLRKVKVKWQTVPSSGRGLKVYGSNTAFSSLSNISSGTEIGTLDASTTEITVSTDYAYVGLVGEGGAIYMDEIDITWQPPQSYTISVDATNGTISTTVNSISVNSAIAGTIVSLSASPNEHYRFENDYIVTKEGGGTVTVENNQFTMPEDNVTVTGTFTRIYTVTIDGINHGTVTATPSAAAEGEGISLEATPDLHYTFESWSVNAGTLSSTTANPTTLTMPASDVTATATFTQKTYTITYCVNGNSHAIAPAQVLGGNTFGTFPADPVYGEYSFLGWAQTEGGTDYVTTSDIPSADMTLYAVFGTTTDEASLTITGTTTGIPSSSSGYGNGSLTIGDAQFAYTQIVQQVSGTNYYVQFKKSYGTLYNTNDFGVIHSIVLTYYGTGTKDISVKASASENPTSTVNVANVDGNVYTYALPENCHYILLTNGSTAASQLSSIEIYYEPEVPVNVPVNITITRINDAQTLSSLGENQIIVVKNGGKLTFTGTNTDPANIIVEDGGQLFVESGAKSIINVAATMQKSIVARSTESDVNKGWTFIASPIVSETLPTDVINMIPSTSTDYDLYRFNENPAIINGIGKEWENYKSHNSGTETFYLSNGYGYLYDNVDDVVLNFVGSINFATDDITVDLQYTDGAEFAGWNLVGNPFTFDAYVNMSYYSLDDDGTAIATEPSQAQVPPCTGIMVHVTEEDQSITFSKDASFDAPNNGSLQMTVGQQTMDRGSVSTVDNAIVSFNEGNELQKFYFGQSNANIYIPQGNKEYAIACAEGQGEMPVNFRANADGQYTLTVNPEGIEMGYLHLIDNMTGANIDLLSTPAYTFNAKTTDYESRFRLVFSANNANTDAASEDTFAFFSNGNLVVNNEGEATLQVIDVMGRVLSNQTISGTAELNLNQQTGVYVLRLVNGNDVKTQKIVVK